ncbi:MFS transporter [Herbiconiux sp. CPCC 205716]|uniref:MFS transporter n=1 Tax=Herbiconiux gentiana TaxID=2970912 RepID=A0ABT2GFC3_9MICO|nr:MFS transporter [Herbiconiux gentiana]MCS5714929.1 MFS transporter [Herbiconiux gentiana]
MMTVTSAWQSRPFRRVWAAGAVAGLGTEIGELAVPVLAVVTLAASATELSLVRAALLVPYLLLTLWLGVVVDRRARRPLLVAADLGRGLLLAIVCGLALAGWLSIPLLVAAAALLGSFAVLSTLAEFSFVPQVVEEDQLIDANARITAAQSAIGVAGAGAGGLLVQLVTAPFALLLNAVGFGISGVLLLRLRVAERVPQPAQGQKPSAWREARAGISVLLRHRVLRALLSEATLWNLGNEILMLALALLVLRDYDFGPAALGLVLMAGGVGAFTGSLLSARLTARFGYGRSLVAAMLIGNSAPLVAVLGAGSASVVSLVVLTAGFVFSGLGIGVANSQAVSLRQLAVEPTMRGRANAGYRLVSWGALSIGALAGGALVSLLGPWAAGSIGAGLMAVATIPVALSPVRRMRRIEEVQPAAAA